MDNPDDIEIVAIQTDIDNYKWQRQPKAGSAYVELRRKSDLNLSELRRANMRRAREWRKDCTEEIPPSFAAMELAGECGEACNEVKKLERSRLGLVGGKLGTGDLAKELADVVICVDLLAIKYGIDLASAVRAKFNETSDKHGFTTKL